MVDLNIDLPEGFLDEEVRCGYTITHEMKKVWAVELDLLNEFMRVCKKYQLKWWADGGTLLGAVRHKGMIPWDDDIDVAMLRDDYDRLCSIAIKEFEQPYFFQTEETDPGSIRGHAQLRNSETTGILRSEIEKKFQFNQGIFLDIFPIDAFPDDDDLLHKQVKNVKYYKIKSYRYRNLTIGYHFQRRRNIIAAVLNHIKHLLAISVMRGYFNYKIPYTEFEQEARKYNNIKTKRVSLITLNCSDEPRYIRQREWYDEMLYMPFEMLTIPVPKGYASYLDGVYGNWHTYVMGTSRHGGVIFDTNKPYTEYIKEAR